MNEKQKHTKLLGRYIKPIIFCQCITKKKINHILVDNIRCVEIKKEYVSDSPTKKKVVHFMYAQ